MSLLILCINVLFYWVLSVGVIACMLYIAGSSGRNPKGPKK